jgi:ribonuclease HI
MATRHSEPLILYIDGSSRGNPGPAGIGVAVFEGGDLSSPVKEISKYIGTATNNVAEYEALIHALKVITASRRSRAIIKLDSELVYKQVTGRYKVRKPHIAIQLRRVRTLQQKIKELSLLLIPRSENKIADRLAQRASGKFKKKKPSFTQKKLIE